MDTNWQKKVESLLKPTPQKSYSSYIIEQIENPKTDLDSFDWEKINSEKWIDILKECPQFANRFHGWDKIAMTDWYKLIKAQPQFIESALKYTTGRSAILKISPNILPDFNDWENIPPQDWRGILLKQPQLIEHCNNTNALRTKDWLHILKIYPQSETIFHYWQIFDSSDFRELIKYQPQFWIYSPTHAVAKIIDDTNNSSECKCWSWFKNLNWVELLSEKPEFADKLKNWSFSSKHWLSLLLKQPQLANKCSDSIYDTFSIENWNELERVNPNVFERQHMLSTLRKISRDD